MKKILITGANSYIGTSLEKWLQKNPEEYIVDTVDMMGDGWKEKDFSGFDVVFHVAGIAHVSSDLKLEKLYYKVNSELTIETAKKAKAEGVKQFIFMSSIIVYGNNLTSIDKKTVPSPSDFYGNSKLQAEKGIKSLENENFSILILRPPMIYGKGSKGNYPKLAKAAVKLPVFPDIENKRSMLHIDNLCEFVKLMIDNQERGLFFPQNAEYVKTSEMVRLIAEVHGKKLRMIKIFNPLLSVMVRKVGLFNKVFGSLVYEKAMSVYKVEYWINELETSVKLTEEITQGRDGYEYNNY